MTMGDAINCLHQPIILRKCLRGLLFPKFHQVATGIILPKITEHEGQIEVTQPKKTSIPWEALLPVLHKLLNTLPYHVFILDYGALKRDTALLRSISG